MNLVYLCLVVCLSLAVSAQDTSLALSSVSRFPSVPIREQSLFVVVSFRAPSLPSSVVTPPVSLTAVLDRSGSMSGQKIELLKRSTEFVVTQLRRGDRMGVVSYSSDVRVDVPLSLISASTRSGIREAIDSITAGGSTNLAGGLFEGVDQQTGVTLSGAAVKSVILFTDGLANQGVTDIRQITSTIQNSLNTPQPPTIYALGFGGDHDADFLQSIAQAGGGQYIFVPDADAIPSAIGAILGGLLTTTAQNIVVDFTPRSGARIISIRGGDVDPSLRRTRFPDLFAEEQRDILIEMRIPVLNDALENQPILDVQLTYFNTIREQTETKRSTIVINRTVGVVVTTPSPLVERTILRFRVADDIATAVSQAESGDTEGASMTLDGTLSAIAASSVSGSSEAQALETDVMATKTSVESGSFDTAAGNAGAATTTTLTTQRAAGSGSASVRATSVQATTSAEATSFAGK